MREGTESLCAALFACPRGHCHYEGSAFCTICGAGPVLPLRWKTHEAMFNALTAIVEAKPDESSADQWAYFRHWAVARAKAALDA